MEMGTSITHFHKFYVNLVKRKVMYILIICTDRKGGQQYGTNSKTT